MDGGHSGMVGVVVGGLWRDVQLQDLHPAVQTMKLAGLCLDQPYQRIDGFQGLAESSRVSMSTP